MEWLSPAGGPGQAPATPPPHRNSGLGRLVRRVARRTISRELDGLRADGIEQVALAARRHPVILAANHVAWWDAFLLMAIDDAIAAESYVVVDRVNLDRFGILARMGCIPLDRDDPRRGLRAAEGVLDRPGRMLWIFPQGRQRPAHLRPLGFRRGVQRLARRVPSAVVVPVGIQYAFQDERHPAAFASLGRPLSAAEISEEDGPGRLERAVEDRLAHIDRHLAGEVPMEVLVPPPRSSRGKGRGARLLRTLLWRSDD